MIDTIFNELDSVYEIMGLLYVSHNYDTVKSETIKSLTENGFNGEKFFVQNFKEFNLYVSEFSKYKVDNCENEAYFCEEDFNYFLILLSLIIDNRDWLSSIDNLTESIINSKILHVCNTLFDNNVDTEECKSIDDIIAYLDSCELQPEARWKMLRIMQDPLFHIRKLIEIINSNMTAFEKAEKSVSVQLDKMLEQYKILVSDYGDSHFFKLKAKITEASVIYPSLIFPMLQMLFENNCYYGLLCDRVVDNGRIRQSSGELLQQKLKALSDNSKMNIILSLKLRPKYNLEIAQELGLTAATMSHHMNVLLNCGLVGVEKKDGKVYYHLEMDNITEFIRELELTLIQDI